MGISADIRKAKDLASLAAIAIRSRHGNKNDKGRGATGHLGFLGGKRQEEEGGALETEESLSFSQSEIPTPSPVTKRSILSYNALQPGVYL
jgi:hypothetical protein